MTRSHRTFTSEIKAEAAGLILDKGYSYTETCRTLNVGESALRIQGYCDACRKEKFISRCRKVGLKTREAFD